MNDLKLKLHMSTIDLIILGILLDKKKNAYELAKFIEDRGIDKFLKVSLPAIYNVKINPDSHCEVIANLPVGR